MAPCSPAHPHPGRTTVASVACGPVPASYVRKLAVCRRWGRDRVAVRVLVAGRARRFDLPPSHGRPSSTAATGPAVPSAHDAPDPGYGHPPRFRHGVGQRQPHDVVGRQHNGVGHRPARTATGTAAGPTGAATSEARLGPRNRRRWRGIPRLRAARAHQLRGELPECAPGPFVPGNRSGAR